MDLTRRKILAARAIAVVAEKLGVESWRQQSNPAIDVCILSSYPKDRPEQCNDLGAAEDHGRELLASS
jgi:hypothetical protein